MRSVIDLIGKFLSATDEGKIKWEVGKTSGYVAALPGNLSLEVWEWVDENTGDPGISVGIRLIGAKEPLDVFAASTYNPKHNDLEKLLSYARGSANNINSIIENLEIYFDN